MRINKILKLVMFILSFQLVVVESYGLNSDSVYLQTEDSLKNNIVAEFPGGKQELYKFILERLVVENDDFEGNIRTKMHLKFTVEKSGKLKDFVVLKSISKVIDEKIIEIFKQMPDWKPAYKNGKPIESSYTMPIQIELK